jgi:hypothetical protein
MGDAQIMQIIKVRIQKKFGWKTQNPKKIKKSKIQTQIQNPIFLWIFRFKIQLN